MSVRDEPDLRARLGAAVEEFQPGPLPFSAVVRRGRAAIQRRRITAAVTFVLVIAAALAAPALLSRASRIAPSGPGGRHVTEFPPGPRSPSRLIAHGTVDGLAWRMFVERSQLGLPAQLCLSIVNVTCSSAGKGLPLSGRPGDPVSVQYPFGDRPLIYGATVRSDVAYVRVSLSDGQVLTLRPVAAFGRGTARWVAIVAPAARAVTRIAAYSAHGELAYAVPFTELGFELDRWLRPGEPPLPRPVTYTIGTGAVAGVHWTEHVYVGPWGTCVGGGALGALCFRGGIGQITGGRPAGQVYLYAGIGAVNVNIDAVALTPAVGYVVVTRADGSTYRPPPVAVGGARFCVFSWGSSDPVGRWDAYSAAGRWLAGSSIP